MTHPLLHPPLELVRKHPVCSTCQAPLKWYDTGKKQRINEIEGRCIDPRCYSHIHNAHRLEEDRANRRALYLCAAMMPLLIMLLIALSVPLFLYKVYEFLDALTQALKEIYDD